VGFGAIEGESDPNPREVQITNQGGGSVTGVTGEIVYGGGPQGWLEATLSGTTAPTTLILQPRTGTLPDEEYSAVVRVAAPVAANSPQEVAVTFTVGEPPPTDVAVEKTGPARATIGDEVEYVITVRNLGSALAVDIVVTDDLPAAVRFVGASDGGSEQEGVVTWPVIERLAPGDAVERRLLVDAPTVGELLNVAHSTARSDDPNPSNNDGSAPASRVSTITTGSPLADGAEGEAYSVQLDADGGDGSYGWSGSPPFGLGLSGGGVVSGTPSGSGTTSFDATVTSGDGQTETASLEITVYPALAITTGSPLADGTLGVAYSETLSATGGTGSYGWSGSPPFGLSLSARGIGDARVDGHGELQRDGDERERPGGAERDPVVRDHGGRTRSLDVAKAFRSVR
jgi:uncharacterized repeat protein (TIGR01451 family)